MLQLLLGELLFEDALNFHHQLQHNHDKEHPKPHRFHLRKDAQNESIIHDVLKRVKNDTLLQTV